MGNDLHRASELVAQLEKLAKEAPLPRPNLPRRPDEIAIDQMAVFGALLVELAKYMDAAQRTIKKLTFLILILTVVLVFEAVFRLLH
jgi:hypothetical protein